MDASTIFNTAVVQTTAISKPSLPKAGFGQEIGKFELPIFPGQTIVAESKRDTGYVSIHINVRIETWAVIKKALEALGFAIGEATKPNANGFSTRVLAAPASHSDVAF